MCVCVFHNEQLIVHLFFRHFFIPCHHVLFCLSYNSHQLCGQFGRRDVNLGGHTSQFGLRADVTRPQILHPSTLHPSIHPSVDPCCDPPAVAPPLHMGGVATHAVW